MKAMVLAAGYGSRLGGLGENLPKAMLPLAGEPLLAHTLRYLGSFGFDEVVINLNHHGSKIREYFGDGNEFGVEITYSEESELLGTAGAVRKVLDFFRNSRDFLVIYGDLLIDQDLSELLAFHRNRGSAATLLLHQRENSNSLVAIDPEARVRTFIERPSAAERAANPLPWVNSGLQMLTPELIAPLQEGVFADLPRDVYIPNIHSRVISGFPLSGFRIAIDSPQRYLDAQRAMENGHYGHYRARQE